jgi:flagellar biosynthesis protein FlhA
MMMNTAAPKHPANNIIAVASGKGGVGKTWFSITLAYLFARSGRRVLLFDGDIGLANVDVQLGINAEKDLGGFVFGNNKLSEVITHFADGGFDNIAGRSGSASLASLSAAKLQALQEGLVELGRSYDFLIIDLGAGVEQYVQALSSLAGRSIVVQKDLDFKEALNTYTLLTIGDGLVSQIPALIVSTAAGLLVTKAGVAGSAEKAVLGQLSYYPTAAGMTSGVLILMALMPGIPALPFLALAGVTGYIAWVSKRNNKIAEDAKKTTAAGGPPALKADGTPADPKPAEEQMAEALQIDSLRLELGYGLLPLINYQKGHRLTEQIKALRKQMARELGFVIPPVRIQDNMQLPANTYVMKVKEVECGRGDIRPDMLLVMDPAGGKITLPGEETTEPTFGLPAMWVADSYREEALFRNYTVVDPPTVITTHLTEIIKDNMADLLSYVETQKLLDDLSKAHQKLVAETIPGQLSVSGVQRVLQNLLNEMISIRDLPTILEAISESSRVTQNITLITEHVRGRLARQISHSHTVDDGYIPIVALSPAWEQTFVESLTGTGEERTLSMAPSKIQDFITNVRKKFDQHAMQGEMPVLLTSPPIRPYVRSIVERFRPNTIVLSQNEIHSRARIKTLGQL